MESPTRSSRTDPSKINNQTMESSEDEWVNIIGGSYIIIAVLLWSLNNMIIKDTGIQISGVLFISNLISAGCCLAYWYIRNPMPRSKLLGDTKREKWTLFFFFLVQSTIFCFYYALVRLPVGDNACIGSQAPLWIILFSSLIFKETLPPWYIYLPALALVVTGVILVAQPTFLLGSAATPLPVDGVIASWLNAVRFLVKTLIIKSVGNTLHSIQYQFVSDLACLVISVPLLLILNTFILHDEWIGTFSNFLHMDYTMWLVSIYIGFTYFIGRVVDMMAVKCFEYQQANASMIAWLEYIAIPLAFLYQVFVFKNIPNELGGVGASMALIGCLIPALHEMSMIVFERKRIGGIQVHDLGDDVSDYQQIEDHDIGYCQSALFYDEYAHERRLSDSNSSYVSQANGNDTDSANDFVSLSNAFSGAGDQQVGYWE